jgi:hypothetical protein
MSAPIPGNPIKDDPKLRQLLEELGSTSGNRQYQQPRMATMISAPSSGNPIKEDPKLQQLLKKLDSVSSKEQFQRWRNSFLKEFEAFLDDADKTARAELIFADFGANLAQLTKLLKQLQGFLENGDLTVDTCTVKARLCCSEVGRQTTVVILQTEALVPGTSAEEKKAGYTKFNVGAALIRDGFVQYGRLQACTEVLEYLRTKTCVEQVADRQILQEMKLHGVKASIFCDVMADLGIFKVMTKCRELGAVEVDDSAGELKPYELKNEASASPPRPEKSPARLDVMEVEDCTGELKPYELEKEAPVSPPRPKKSPARCQELDVMEVEDSNGELKPCELENEAPASPPRPKMSPAKPQTPESSKTPKKAKLYWNEDLKPYEYENEAAASRPRTKNKPTKLQTPKSSKPAAKDGYDNSEKAVRARNIGKVDDSSPAEERRKEEDQYKPVKLMDKNLNSYYHGSDGPGPFFFLDKKREKKDGNSSGSSSDEEEPPSEKIDPKPKQMKNSVKKENELGNEEERGDGGGIDEEKRQEPCTFQKTPKPKEGRKKKAEKKEPEIGDDAGDEEVLDEAPQPTQKENTDNNAENQWTFAPQGLKCSSLILGTEVPAESPQPAQKGNQPRNRDAKENRKKKADEEDSDEETPDESPKPLQKGALADEDEEQVGLDADDRKTDDDDEPPDDKAYYGDDGAPTKSPLEKNTRGEEDEEPDVDGNTADDRDNDDSSDSKAAGDDRARGEPPMPTGEHSKPQEFTRPSADNEDGDGIYEEHQEPVQKSDRPRSGMRPSTMRGASFSEDDGGGVPKKSPELPQQTSKPKSDIRLSAMRGASFSDGDGGGGGIPEKPQEPTDNSNKPKSGVRPSTLCKASFCDDEGSGVLEKPQESLATYNKPKSGMKPCTMCTMCGASFGDNGVGGVPEKHHELVQKSDKPNRGIRPSTRASFSEDDGGGVPEKSQELPQQTSKPKSDMRPSTMRGASFSDGDGGGIPEKPHEPPSGMVPSTMRRASSGDDDGVPQQSTLMRPIPVKRVENQPIDPEPIKDEKERNKDMDHFKNQVKPAKIPSDDSARGIEITPNHHNPTDFITTEKSLDVKARVVQSAPTKKKKTVDLEKRRKCLMWYARMTQPNRADMKRRVAGLPESCDITVADVDDLPWMPGGKRLSIFEMNKLFLEFD